MRLSEDDEIYPLPSPKGQYATLLRRLAEAAMSVTHHDASDDEPGYRHEVQAMERRFRRIFSGMTIARRTRKEPKP